MVPQTRTPAAKALEFLDELNKKSRLTKWGMIKIAGNEAQFSAWVTNFLLFHKFVEEAKEGRVTFYRKTPRGELFHKTLQEHRFTVAYLQISGRRLKRAKDIKRW